MAHILIVEDQLELASLLTAAIAARGHTSIEAHTGQESRRLLEGVAFDAAIVDLLLPDMRGGEILDALGERKVPAFAVSGVFKGHLFARAAVEKHGARAFYEKPFDLKELLDAVESATGTRSAGSERAVEVDALPELDPPLVDASLPFAEREKVWSSGERVSPAAGFDPSGSVAPGTLARLLNAFYVARHTGELKLRQGPVLKVVFFQDGEPVYAASNLAQERFARFCVRRGAMAEKDIAAVAALAQEANLRTGEAMVQLGLIGAKQRRELLEAQVKEIIWSTFSWTGGDYAFVPRRPARLDRVELSVYPGNLILDGARQEPLVALRRKLPPERRLFPTADPPYDLHEIQMTGAEARLLASADGSKAIEDLLVLTDLPEREALGVLHGLELAAVLEERKDERKQRRISYGL